MATTLIKAERAAVVAAEQLGLRGSVQRLRSGANHVFRIGDGLFRVPMNGADTAPQVALARWLLDEGIPVVRPLADRLIIAGVQVTAWEYIGHGEPSPLGYRRLGEAISHLHRIPLTRAAEHASLPWCGDAPWLQLQTRVEVAARSGVLAGEDIDVLRAVVSELDGWEAAARGDDLVVCHGDLHPQNVLMGDDRIVVIDWDAICLGPAAWDHAALLSWASRWGGDPADYDAFAAGYGRDLRAEPVAQLLARVRLLAPTLNMVIRGSSSPRHAAEARRRMRFWRGDPSAPPWRPQ